jgi:hypothetical protein
MRRHYLLKSDSERDLIMAVDRLAHHKRSLLKLLPRPSGMISRVRLGQQVRNAAVASSRTESGKFCNCWPRAGAMRKWLAA